MDLDDEHDDDVWRAPLPAHERDWRHPSEVAELITFDDTVSGASRALVVASAAAGLVLVAALAVMITPSSGSTPLAVESTAGGPAGAGPLLTVAGARLDQELMLPTRPSALTTVALITTTALRPTPPAAPVVVTTFVDTGPAPETDPSVATTEETTTTVASTSTTAATTSSTTMPAAPMYATPLGNGSTAVVLGLFEPGSSLTVVLPDGQPTSATAVEQRVAIGVSLVSLQTHGDGYVASSTAPVADTMVTVMAGRAPMRVAFGELGTKLSPEHEGAALVDDAGQLVGICRRAAGQHIIPADQLGGAGATATTTTAP